MKTSLPFFLLFFFNCFFLISQTNYYVSTDGDDANPGSFDSPFLTIQQAVSIGLAPGDTVFVKQGAYRGVSLNTTMGMTSGTPTKPIVFCAYQGNVIINIEACNIHNPNDPTDMEYKEGIIIADVNYIDIIGFEFLDIERNGIFLINAQHISVLNNKFKDTGERAISSYCASHLLIENNICTNSGKIGIALSVGGDSIIIRGNQIRGSLRDGILISDYVDVSCASNEGITSNVVIEKNFLSNNAISNGASINLSGTPGVKVINNFIIGSKRNGINLWQGPAAIQSSNNAFIANNTIINDPGNYWCIAIQASDVSLYNNYLFNKDSIYGSIALKSDISLLSSLASDYNAVDSQFCLFQNDELGYGNSVACEFIPFNIWQTGTNGKDVNSISSRPPDDVFLNPTLLDFHLKDTSLLIDKGTAIVSNYVSDDYDHIPRPQADNFDIGAIEYICPTNMFSTNINQENICSGETILFSVNNMSADLIYELIVDDIPTGIPFMGTSYMHEFDAVLEDFTIGLLAYNGNDKCTFENNNLYSVEVGEYPFDLVIEHPDKVCWNEMPTVNFLNTSLGFDYYIPQLDTTYEGNGSSLEIFMPALLERTNFQVVLQELQTGCEYQDSFSIDTYTDPNITDLNLQLIEDEICLDSLANFSLSGSSSLFSFTMIIDSIPQNGSEQNGLDQNLALPFSSTILDRLRIYSFGMLVTDLSNSICQYPVFDMINVQPKNCIINEKKHILCTPNGDSDNDMVIFDIFEHCPKEVWIVNRYNQTIFHSSSGCSAAWDGRFKGKLVSTGSYLYKATFEQGEDITGTILLARE